MSLSAMKSSRHGSVKGKIMFAKYYKGSFIFAFISVVITYFMAGGIAAAIQTIILGMLEVSMSLDNAVVNAKVLETLDDKWRHRFLTWGMLFAVFGVRVLFPILIVWGTSSLSFVQSVLLPFEDAKRYADTVTAAHVSIAGFGGTFLLMVFLSFFFDQEKENHWIPGIEKVMQFLGKFTQNSTVSTVVFAAASVLWVGALLHEGEDFMYAALFGGIAWIVVHLLGEFLEGRGTASAAKVGLGSFIYLNVLDASFSFDGVVGAFAISNNIIIIGLGLGMGAMFVRSMTIHMVDKGTLGELQYLEHGAFWSIGILAGMMFANTIIEIPDIITGLSAVVVLTIATIHSIIENRRNVSQ
ncbi:hypothetical protein RsoM2USA_18 [Ralstonia phage RsoM2USA]|nr:hypothetical protein RsoM2USA_18 [Ralstonia phage RsoM2USA]